MRLVELYVNYSGTLDEKCVGKLVSTNASDDVIKSVCDDVKSDGIHKRSTAIDAIVKILCARGFECEVMDNIPRFGFTE